MKKSGSRVGETGKSMYLYCSRSGKFVSQGTGQRCKKLGSSKISAHCTALIKYFEESSGKVKATVCSTHYGHDRDHRFLRLTKEQKQYIADKMKSGMPRELVLDSLRSTFVNKLDRIHELSKKDLNNIRKTYNIPKTKNVPKPKQVLLPGTLLMENWVKDVDVGAESPVLFYKKPNYQDESARKSEKILILMTKGQKDLFVKFCNNGVLYVTSSKLAYPIPLHLTVIFILDDFYEMFPVCFMISNDASSDTLKTCFNQLLDTVGPVALRAFATDDQEFVHEAWREVMGGSSRSIIANRHVDMHWRQNLSVVENEAQQGEIYDKLYDFIENADGTEDKMTSLIAELRASFGLAPFASYLEQNYLRNIRSWSTCYLKESYDLREPVDFEMSYSKISNLCEMCGRCNKPVSYLVNGLIKLLLDFQSNRNRKVAESVIEIGNAHDASAGRNVKNVFPLTNGVWKVSVEEGSAEFFEVQVENCNFDDCVLMCPRCEACVHNFRCVCDSYVDGKTCVHVHLVGSMLKNIRTDTTTATNGDVILWKWEEEDGSDAVTKSVAVERTGETNELCSRKLETLKILQDIGRKLMNVKDENNLERVHNCAKEFQSSVDVLLNYGNHVKSVAIAKNSTITWKYIPKKMKKCRGRPRLKKN